MSMADELKSAQEGKNLLASMVVDLETQLEGAKAEKAEAFVDNASLANEVRRLEGVIAEVTKERDSLLSEASTEKSAMAKSIEELQSQLDGLVFERDGAEKAKRRSEDAWRLERQSLEEQLRKSRKFNDELNEQLATKELEHARALAEKQEARHVSRSERQMRELFEGHLSEAKSHQDFLRTRMRELEAEAAEATAQYHKVGDTVYSLQDRCTELEQANAALKTQAAATEAMLRDELSNAQRDLTAAMGDNKTLTTTVQELKDLLVKEKELLNKKSEELATLAARGVKLKARLADGQDDELLLTQQIDQLKETISLLSKEKQGMLQQKSGEKDTYMEELRVLRQALTMAESNTEAALTQVRTEKNQIMLEMQDLAEQLASSQADVKSLTSQLDATETAVARALADKEELEGERRFLEGECRELTSQLTTSRAEKEARDVECAELQVLLRSQEVELQDDRGDLTRTKTDASVMIRGQDEMRATFQKLRDENELLHAQVNQLNEHLQTVEVNNRRLEFEVASSAGAASAAAAAAQQAAAAAGQVGGRIPQVQVVQSSSMPTEEFRGLVAENERMRDRIIDLEEELAQTVANKEVDRSIMEEQLHHAEARAEKAELVDEIEDKLREALEEIARLESELVQTRAEAAERDIQWQAEVDALAETYEKLQMELKRRERDIEEMKEGAWLSAELQYMAKKIEDYEIAERKHIQEQKEILDKLEDKDREIAFMAAKADEGNGTLRALENELNDERFTNKDLVRELHNLRVDVERAEADKEKALAAAEKFVQRTVESTSADRETLKGALKELGSSLDTIRSDKARALQERDEIISARNAEIHQLNKNLAAMTAQCEEIEKQLHLSQHMLKAALASSASRFGQTISNYRSGLITSGFRTWVSWFSHAKLESKIEELELSLSLALNQGRMIALKKVLGRWKNQGMYMGFREWNALYEEGKSERRLNRMLANMTDEERKRALERLNSIICSWNGDNLKYTWIAWNHIVSEGRQSKTKLKYAASKWYKAHLSRGFSAWKYYATLSAEEQAQLEINDLKWRLQRTLQTWMKDKFTYEARIYSEAQKSRTFSQWKYVTDQVNKINDKMKMMLGTMKRDKNQQAFRKLMSATANSKLRAREGLDRKLIESARKKALEKMNRVIHHMMHMKLHMGWMSWYEDTLQKRRDKAEAEHKKLLEIAEAAGYKRARDEFEADIEFLRNALQHGRAAAFAKYVDIFIGNADKRGKTYALGMWRSWTHDKAGRMEEERRLAELARLKAELKDAQADAAALKNERFSLNQTIKELEAALAGNDSEFEKRLKQMQHDLEETQTKLNSVTTQYKMDKQHLEAMVTNKERSITDLQADFADRDNRSAQKMARMQNKCQELEVDRDEAVDARRVMLKKSRDSNFEVEQTISLIREELQKSEQDKRRAQSDLQVVNQALAMANTQAAQASAEEAKLNSEVMKLRAKIGQMETDMDALQKKHAKAEAMLTQATK